MKIELHLHTNRYSGCAVNSADELMPALIEAGYQAVFITEHQTMWSDAELEALRAAWPDIAIHPGVELRIAPYEADLLVLGTNDEAYVEHADDPPVVLDMARRRGHATVLAHPFRWPGADAMLDDGLLPDAIEGRTCNHEAEPAARAVQAGERLGLPVVHAGDVHALDMVGRFWIETDGPVADARELRSVLRERRYVNHPAGNP